MKRSIIVQVLSLLLSFFTLHDSDFAGAQCAPNTLLHALSNPAPVANDGFGRSVGVSGDLVAVGAWKVDVGGMVNEGMAQVFSASTGALVSTLNNPEPDGGNEFGDSVAISGNLAVVGKPSHNPGGAPGAGVAYVFNATTGALIVTLFNPSPATGDFFGKAVAILGELAVVGAWQDDGSGVADSGTAYVFSATTGEFVATLVNPAPGVFDAFGYSVSISGDVAVVGAPFDTAAGVANAGMAHVFNANSGALTATLNNPTPAESDTFGGAVAVEGDVAIVGAFQDAPRGVFDAGTAYLFNATTGALDKVLNNPAPAVFDNFGVSVAVSGTKAVVGVYNAPGGASNAGTAYVFDTETGDIAATLNNPAPEANDYFGNAVAISGNIAVAGADGDNPAGISDAGSAFVFTCTNAHKEMILAYLLGIHNESSGLDDNSDGAVDVADLVSK